jgi:hypothetical protein
MTRAGPSFSWHWPRARNCTTSARPRRNATGTVRIPAAARARLTLCSRETMSGSVGQNLATSVEDRVEHLRCQAAGVGVVARAVIARENPHAIIPVSPHDQRGEQTVCRRARARCCHVKSCPSVTIARRLRHPLIVAFRNFRQVLISAPTGLFCGGTHLTALVIAVRLSFAGLLSRLASNVPGQVRVSQELHKEDRRQSSPVKGTPVRLAPRRPGARPTISKLDRAWSLRGIPGLTGALCQSGNRCRFLSAKSCSRGHRLQSWIRLCHGPAGMPDTRPGSGSIVEIVFALHPPGA